jgi:hypothetical protein
VDYSFSKNLVYLLTNGENKGPVIITSYAKPSYVRKNYFSTNPKPYFLINITPKNPKVKDFDQIVIQNNIIQDIIKIK